MKITLKVASTVFSMLAILVGFGVWVYSYHSTLSTNNANALLYAELRIKDVEDSIARHKKKTDEEIKTELASLNRTLERLNVQREKLMGFSGD